MKFKKIVVLIILLSCNVVNPVSFAQEKGSLENIEMIKPWNRFSVNLGGFLAGVNTGIRIGSKQLGIGIDINLEDALGMETQNFVFRSDAMYRFGKKKKHSIKASYFSFTRSAKKVLESEIEIGDHIFPIGANIESRFDLSIFNVAYDYSFFSDERVNMGISLGLFIMPIKFEAGIGGKTDEATDFVAPLPVLGLRTDFAVTQKLYIKQSAEVLYLDLNGFTGSILDLSIRLENNTFKHFGFGLGLNMYTLKIESNGKKYHQIDMVGNLEMGYTGLLFFGKYYF